MVSVVSVVLVLVFDILVLVLALVVVGYVGVKLEGNYAPRALQTLSHDHHNKQLNFKCN